MHKPVICIGAAFIDELFHTTGEMLIATTNEAVVTKTAGGVSRNIAHQLALLDVPVQLISVFGNDSDGDWLKNICLEAGVKTEASLTIEGSSGKYTGILKPDGSLFLAYLTGQTGHLLTAQYLAKQAELLATASYILADANLNVEAIEWLLNFSQQAGIPFIIEPVSVPPAKKLKNAKLKDLYLVTPNEDELPTICSDKAGTTEEQVAELLSRGVQHIWLHNGKEGSVIYSMENTIELRASIIDVVDSTGAGDSSLAGFILGKWLGKDDLNSLKLAHTLSAEILKVNGAIAAELTRQKLLDLVSKYYPDNE